MGNILGQRHGYSSFKHDWGVHVLDIAEKEGKTPEAIYLRVYRFGSPFQRRKNPSAVEKHYAKTQSELAYELGMHPLTLSQKHRHHGSVYHKQPRTDSAKGWTTTDHGWKSNPKYNAKPWLMEEHPDYAAWRAGELFADVHQNKPENY